MNISRQSVIDKALFSWAIFTILSVSHKIATFLDC